MPADGDAFDFEPRSRMPRTDQRLDRLSIGVAANDGQDITLPYIDIQSAFASSGQAGLANRGSGIEPEPAPGCYWHVSHRFGYVPICGLGRVSSEPQSE
jgi:hypothetical protein